MGSHSFDGRVDVWSLAGVLVNMALPHRGSMFDARSGPELLKQIVEIFGTNGKDEASNMTTETVAQTGN